MIQDIDVKQKRIEYIDQLRAVAIILVVMGHSIQNNTLESTQAPLFSWIYSFHMPLFMFISGYVAFKTMYINKFSELFIFIKNRALRLLIPYFTWSIIVNNFFFVRKSNFNIISAVISAVTVWNQYWFLFVLFILLVIYSIFFVISQKINTHVSIFVEILILLISILFILLVRCFHIPTPVIDINSYLLYFLYFFLGHFIAKFSILSNVFLDKRIFSFFALVFILFSGRYDFNDLGILNKIIKTVVSISAIASLYYIVIKIQWNPFVAKYFKIIGQSTLVIYTTHFSLSSLVKCAPPLLSHLSNFSLIIFTLAFSMFVIAGCLAIKKIAELSPLFNFILYGQKIKIG